jgi:hypothetical protein
MIAFLEARRVMRTAPTADRWILLTRLVNAG